LERISIVLDDHPVISEQAFSDLVKTAINCKVGRKSLSANQVVRAYG